jgi:hypothetical protein
MEDDKLSPFLQENILILLCFDESAGIIANNVPVELFENAIYREIAKQGIDYYRKYSTPIADHLPDVLEHKLTKDKTGALYEKVIKDLYVSKDSINKSYVLDSLEKFVRIQEFKKGLFKAAEIIQDGGSVDDAELAISSSVKKKLSLFDAGIQFGKDINRTLGFLDSITSSIPVGIKALDDFNIGPAPKELLVFMGLKGRGKSWYIINAAKFALLQRLKVLIITLEMSEVRYSQRLTQALFSWTKRPMSEIMRAVFDVDERGVVLKIRKEFLKDLPSLTDKDSRKLLTEKFTKMRTPHLIIKEFPTGQLTMPALRAYLKNLEAYNGFTPDILFLDYVDLMKTEARTLRLEIGQYYKELRGLGIEYNMAAVTPSQANREGEDAKLITGKYSSEDYSKGMTADTIITYNQTPMEKKLGLARLFVDKARNEEDGRTVLLAQAYSIGQFCLQSAFLPNKYGAVLKDLTGEE